MVEVGEVGGGPSLLFMASSWLQTWLDGVQQIEQSCRAHREVFVEVRGGRLLAGRQAPGGEAGSWRGVSVSVLVLVLVLVLVSAVGSMLSLSQLK